MVSKEVSLTLQLFKTEKVKSDLLLSKMINGRERKSIFFSKVLVGNLRGQRTTNSVSEDNYITLFVEE